jgi:hypothetical protein
MDQRKKHHFPIDKRSIRKSNKIFFIETLDNDLINQKIKFVDKLKR